MLLKLVHFDESRAHFMSSVEYLREGSIQTFKN